MNCIKCGANNDAGDVFCIYCGEKIDTGIDPVSQSIKKRRKRGPFIGISAAVVALIAVAAVLLFILNVAPAFGNSPNNIRNAGIAAESDGWIYYSNSADGHSLYKIRTDGTEKTKLNSEGSTSINVAGGWVYYRNQYSISRVRADSTGRETIYEDANVTRLYVYGDWIYFTVLTDKVGQMYRMRLNGTEVTEYDESLFREALKEDVDGWSYGNSDGGIVKVSADGAEWEILTSDKANNVNAADGWVYYSNVSDKGSLYKIRTDGTEKTKLNDVFSGNINIAGDWIYYINRDEKGAIYRIKTDGSENQPVE